MWTRARSLPVAVVAVFAALSLMMLGASLAFACTPPNFGTPTAPPAAEAEPDPAASAPAQGAPAQPAPSSADSTAAVGSGSVSGARTPSVAAPQATSPAPQATDPARRGAAQPAPVGGGSRATAPAAPADQFATRDGGGTEGVTSQGGQQVFASSTAKGKKPAGARAGAASAPAEGGAVSDVWSGFSSGSAASEAGAPAAALAGEKGSGATLGLAILGLGLVGVLGTFVVLAAPRRRLAEANRQRTRRKERSGQ